ncbi:MAG TPA: methylated-DNA--[protein]-cysteine S-methyltransferase [Candidatus Kapabacteria bacterium]|nr:methylated-DNA--[protein]-cysteine S-methyltransferase [Candidatus Kapabacteria bacterium]
MSTKELLFDTIQSPVGPLTIVADGTSIVTLEFGGHEGRMEKMLEGRFGAITMRRLRDPLGATSALEAYLAGELNALDVLPVDPGGTPFQQKVWRALRTIPVGQAISYAELAMMVEQPAAYRAVGNANSRNPIAIAIPCHRVIGSSAALTGYAGGLERKRWLLEHEGFNRSAFVASERERRHHGTEPIAFF